MQGWAGLRPLALRAINQNKLKSGSPSTYGALSNRTFEDQDWGAPTICTQFVCKVVPKFLVTGTQTAFKPGIS